MDPPARDPFWDSVREHWSPVDLLLLAVPCVLVAVWGLPPRVRESLTLSFADPTLLTAYTTHFVHLSRSHLLANLLTYAVVVPVAYLLSAQTRTLPLFRRAVVVVVAVVPFGLAVATVAVIPVGFGAGFSGLNMALLGLLTLFLGAYLDERRPTGLDRWGGTLYLGTLAVVAVLAVPDVLRGGLLAAAALLGAGLTLGRGERGADRSWLRSGLGHLELAVLGVGLLAALPVLGFRYGGGGLTDAVRGYVHVLGYVLAFVPAYATVRLREDGWSDAESQGSWGSTGSRLSSTDSRHPRR
jgi:hypothetical protein